MQPLIIRGMWGLGDNIFQRPFVRAACAHHDVFLETPWPELYSDLPVKFLRGDRALRTQQKNLRRQAPDRWSVPPAYGRAVQVRYGHNELARGSILTAMEKCLPLGGTPLALDLPAEISAPAITSSSVIRDVIAKAKSRPIALVRPVTVRREWRNEARNPKPVYLARIAELLMATHHVVALADLADGEEWMASPAPPAHQQFLAGELDVRQLLALTSMAGMVVGGVGWIVPASIAARVNCFVILGGMGAHNAPARITDPRLACSRLGFAMPDRFCACANMLHHCDKAIADVCGQFAAFAAALNVTRAA